MPRGTPFDPYDPAPQFYQRFFLHWVTPPYTCEHCGGVIDHTLPKLTANGLVIHHVDHDHSNVTLENLMPLHRRCHPTVHLTGTKRTDEQRRRMSEAQRALELRGERATWYGRSHSDEAKQAISLKAMERAKHPRPCDECGESYPVHVLPGHIRVVHRGESYHGDDGVKKIVNAARKNMENSKKWCDECQREWTHTLWPRHIRKYHEGGKW